MDEFGAAVKDVEMLKHEDDRMWRSGNAGK
jgi:hypothetical protein